MLGEEKFNIIYNLIKSARMSDMEDEELMRQLKARLNKKEMTTTLTIDEILFLELSWNILKLEF